MHTDNSDEHAGRRPSNIFWIASVVKWSGVHLDSSLFLLSFNRLVGLVVKATASTAEDPVIFSGRVIPVT